MAGNNNTKNDSTQKIVTKYDKKMAKRKAEQRKQERESFIFKVVGIGVLAGILLALVITLGTRYSRIHNKFIKVDSENISQIEFDMYYNISKNSLLSQTFYGNTTMADYFSYMGYKSSENDKSQTNSQTGGTWYAYFADNAVNTIKETKALLKDAADNNYEYTTADEDYNKLVEQAESAAAAASLDEKAYYKQNFGNYATKKNIKSYLMEYLKADAYRTELTDSLKATDDEVKQYYEEHKDTYDQVDYREFTIKAVDTTAAGDTFCGGLCVALSEGKNLKDAIIFASKASVSEQAFNDLCKRYADDGDTKYDDINGSLFSKVVSSNMDTGTSDWLLSDDRKAGDVTVIENSSSGCYYVLYFINKSYDGSSDETIASNVLNNKYSEYISNITDSMQVDIYNRF